MKKMKVADLEAFYAKVVTAWYQHEWSEDLEDAIEEIVEEYRLKEEGESL